MRKVLLLTVLALLVVGVAVPALADASVIVNPGVISMHKENIVFDAITLNGANQYTVDSTDLTPWTANDPTGLGLGWTVSIKSTDFIMDGDATKTIPLSAGFEAQLKQTTVAAGAGVQAPVPNTQMAALTLLTNSDQVMLKANVDEGMGFYSYLPNFRLLVPASTYAGTYRATVDVTTAALP